MLLLHLTEHGGTDIPAFTPKREMVTENTDKGSGNQKSKQLRTFTAIKVTCEFFVC